MKIVCELSPEVEISINPPHRLKNFLQSFKDNQYQLPYQKSSSTGCTPESLPQPLMVKTGTRETHTPAAIPMPSLLLALKRAWGTRAVLHRPQQSPAAEAHDQLRVRLVVAPTTLPSTLGSRIASIPPPAGEKSSKVSPRLS